MERFLLFLRNPLSLIGAVFTVGLVIYGYEHLPVYTGPVTVQYYFKGMPTGIETISAVEMLARNRFDLVMHTVEGYILIALAGMWFFPGKGERPQFLPAILLTIASIVIYLSVIASITP